MPRSPVACASLRKPELVSLHSVFSVRTPGRAPRAPIRGSLKHLRAAGSRRAAKTHKQLGISPATMVVPWKNIWRSSGEFIERDGNTGVPSSPSRSWFSHCLTSWKTMYMFWLIVGNRTPQTQLTNKHKQSIIFSIMTLALLALFAFHLRARCILACVSAKELGQCCFYVKWIMENRHGDLSIYLMVILILMSNWMQLANSWEPLFANYWLPYEWTLPLPLHASKRIVGIVWQDDLTIMLLVY